MDWTRAEECFTARRMLRMELPGKRKRRRYKRRFTDVERGRGHAGKLV